MKMIIIPDLPSAVGWIIRNFLSINWDALWAKFAIYKNTFQQIVLIIIKTGKKMEKQKSNKILPCMLLCQVWAVQGISQKMQKLEGEIGFG